MLDLSKCRNLDYLYIRNTKVIMNLFAGQLTFCSFQNYDFSKGNVLDVLHRLKHLKTLSIINCVSGTFTKDTQTVISLDLFKRLDPEQLATGVILGHFCICPDNTLSAIPKTKSSKTCPVYHCKSFKRLKNDTPIPALDLSECNDVKSICVRNACKAINICADNVTECILERCDLLKGNILEALQISKNLSVLHMYACESELYIKDIKGIVSLDLTKCTNLKTLDIRNTNVAINICVDTLTVCILQKI